MSTNRDSTPLANSEIPFDVEPFVERWTGWRLIAAWTAVYVLGFAFIVFTAWLIYQAVIAVDWLLSAAP